MIVNIKNASFNYSELKTASAGYNRLLLNPLLPHSVTTLICKELKGWLPLVTKISNGWDIVEQTKTCTRIQAHKQTHAHTHTYMHTHTHTHTHAHTCIHTRIYSHTHTHAEITDYTD